MLVSSQGAFAEHLLHIYINIMLHFYDPGILLSAELGSVLGSNLKGNIYNNELLMNISGPGVNNGAIVHAMACTCSSTPMS